MQSIGLENSNSTAWEVIKVTHTPLLKQQNLLNFGAALHLQ